MWLSVWSEVPIVCIMVQLMPLHPKTLSSLASFNPGWFTQVILDKRPLIGCSSGSGRGSGSGSTYVLKRKLMPLLDVVLVIHLVYLLQPLSN